MRTKTIQDTLRFDDLTMTVHFERTVIPYTAHEEVGSDTVAVDESTLVMTSLEAVTIELFNVTLDLLPILTDREKQRIIRIINEDIYE